jgi:hypothetical protein
VEEILQSPLSSSTMIQEVAAIISANVASSKSCVPPLTAGGALEHRRKDHVCMILLKTRRPYGMKNGMANLLALLLLLIFRIFNSSQ